MASKHSTPNLIEFIALVSDTEKCISFLFDNNLLQSECTCVCGKPMSIIKRARSVTSDGRIWRCGTCKKSRSLRKNSFFQASSLVKYKNNVSSKYTKINTVPCPKQKKLYIFLAYTQAVHTKTHKIMAYLFFLYCHIRLIGLCLVRL